MDLSHIFVSTVAGGGDSGWLDGPAVAARFGNRLWGVAVDPITKSVYVADTDNHRIRIVREGDVSTLAGNGSGGFASGSALTKAQFCYPYGLTVDSRGAVYVTDRENQRVRSIKNGVVEVFAGSGTTSWREDGPAARASFNDPTGICIDDETNTVYVSDHGSNSIRAVRDGVVTTVAGAGVLGFSDGIASEAKFNTPWQMAYDPIAMALYIADYGNHRIRKLQNGLVTTVAGTGVPGCDDGPVSSATLYHPVGIAVDPRSGAIFCTDYSGHRVRMILNGNVVTVCGASGQGLHDGQGPKSRFRNPASIAFDLDTYKLHICDMGNHRIRVFSAKFLNQHIKWRPLSFQRLLKAGDLADLELTVCGENLRLHRCIVAFRCPSLLEKSTRSKLGKMAVTKEELEIIEEYIYCDRIPPALSLSPTKWLHLSVRRFLFNWFPLLWSYERSPGHRRSSSH
jgi:DNA-binding beta-propeller fold protein YncE